MLPSPNVQYYASPPPPPQVHHASPPPQYAVGVEIKDDKDNKDAKIRTHVAVTNILLSTLSGSFGWTFQCCLSPVLGLIATITYLILVSLEGFSMPTIGYFTVVYLWMAFSLYFVCIFARYRKRKNNVTNHDETVRWPVLHARVSALESATTNLIIMLVSMILSIIALIVGVCLIEFNGQQKLDGLLVLIVNYLAIILMTKCLSDREESESTKRFIGLHAPQDLLQNNILVKILASTVGGSLEWTIQMIVAPLISAGAFIAYIVLLNVYSSLGSGTLLAFIFIYVSAVVCLVYVSLHVRDLKKKEDIQVHNNGVPEIVSMGNSLIDAGSRLNFAICGLCLSIIGFFILIFIVDIDNMTILNGFLVFFILDLQTILVCKGRTDRTEVEKWQSLCKLD